MTVFIFEYFFFIVAIVAILVTVSSAALFLITYQYEQQLRTIWRAAGFSLLALAFFIYILERKYLDVDLIAVVAVTIETIGLYSIYKGVRAEPQLSQLAGRKRQEKKNEKEPPTTSVLWRVLAILILVALVPVNYYFTSYVSTLFIVVSLVLVVLTLRIQVDRYQSETKDQAVKRQYLWPLLGYVFLLFRLLSHLFFRLPDTNVAFLQKLTVEYSIAWQLCAFYTVIAFALLGYWAWNYIKLREFLRRYVVFLAMTVFVSTLGSLVFSLLVFRIVETNNLGLMRQAVETEELIMDDRLSNSVFFAQLMATDASVIENLRTVNTPSLYDDMLDYNNQINVNRIRVYNSMGEVVASPTDPIDEGKVYADDDILGQALDGHMQIQTYDTVEGELTDLLATRAIYPIVVANVVIGAVEVGYEFDNTFVDFSQSITGLDVSMYTGGVRSATTIYSPDGISRWAGSEEDDSRILEDVLIYGSDFYGTVDYLGVDYYAAYKPVRDYSGMTIGMVSVGTPTAILIQDTRQQLVNSFLLVTMVSLATALIGYVALSRATRLQPVSKKKKKKKREKKRKRKRG